MSRTNTYRQSIYWPANPLSLHPEFTQLFSNLITGWIYPAKTTKINRPGSKTDQKLIATHRNTDMYLVLGPYVA